MPAGALRRVLDTLLLATLAAVLLAPEAQAQLRLGGASRLGSAGSSLDESGEDFNVRLYRRRPPARAGLKDLSSGWALQLGQGLRRIEPVSSGQWRGELQFVRSGGNGTEQPFGRTYRRGLWAIGRLRVPFDPAEGSTLTAFAQAGLHHLAALSPSLADPGQKAGLRLGAGAGLQWRLGSGATLQLEYNRLGLEPQDRREVFSLAARLPL
ncbi:MAG: hypothetical protein RJA44_2070 [Pseudomonadota bacterium]